MRAVSLTVQPNIINSQKYINDHDDEDDNQSVDDHLKDCDWEYYLRLEAYLRP